MKKYFIYLQFIILFATIISCNFKNKSINDLSILIENIENNTSNFTNEDWENVVNQLESIDAEFNKNRDQYSDEEIKEFGRLKGKCAAIITKKALNSAVKTLQETTSETKDFLEAFFQEMVDE